VKVSKNWLLLAYIWISVWWEELFLTKIMFKQFDIQWYFMLLMTLPFIFLLWTFLVSEKPKTQVWTLRLTMLVVVIYYGAQWVYFSIYDAIISVYSFTAGGGQVMQFYDMILNVFTNQWYVLLGVLAPLLGLLFFSAKKAISSSLTKRLILLLLAIEIQAVALMYIYRSQDDSVYSLKNLYYKVHAPQLLAPKIGLLPVFGVDLWRYVTGFEEDTTIVVDPDNQPKPEPDILYNMMSVNFNQLIAGAPDSKIKSMHQFFYSQTPTKQNAYTGYFKDKNLIVFVAEGFSELAIREDLTPTLYKMANGGFKFENFYTPIFPVSTSDGEFIADTGILPKEGVWSATRIAKNAMPFSFANRLEPLGYSSNSYHNHFYAYYNRDQYLKAMGYNSYLACGNGLEKRMNCDRWPNSDYEMMKVTMKDYINKDKFTAYYMTVSGHLNYTVKGNNMASRHWDEVKHLPYSEKARAYLATQLELERALKETIAQLEAAGKLNDTVIVISGDHFPYGLTLKEINELSTYQRDDTFEKYAMPLIIWNAAMKEPVVVDKLASSVDILPTVLNLMGVPYDSRFLMGRDIMSDTKPIVIFSNRNFIIKEGRYVAKSDKFYPNDGQSISAEDLDYWKKFVADRFSISRLIIEKDYYRYILPYVGVEPPNNDEFEYWY
jgi:lipoteichoic acid synthase